jgi:hypothetical protein
MNWKSWSVLGIRGILVMTMAAVIPGLSHEHRDRVACRGNTSAVFVLEAQAVPSATQIPCFSRLPVGWKYGVTEFRPGLARTLLDSDRAGDKAVELVLAPTCDVSRAIRDPAAHVPRGVARFDEPRSLHPHSSVSYFRFTGGCVTYRFSFTQEKAPTIFQQADLFLGFTPRREYVAGVRHDESLTLCGAGAPPCLGETNP